MKISVICVTARMGGLDVLVNGFNQQVFDDFEVIVVDSCYDRRILDRPLPDNYIHVRTPDKYPYYDACYACNFGLKHASGELIVPFSDLNWPDANLLVDCWRVFQTYPGYSMTGFLDRYPLPPLKPNLSWHNSSWTLFAEDFTAEYAEGFFAANPIIYSERKGLPADYAGPYVELPPDKFYVSLNESIPMAVLKEIRGYDETYDGAYGSSDIDIGCRAYAAGWRFLINPKSINRKFGNHGSLTHVPGCGKPTIRSSEDNYAIFERRRKEFANDPRATLVTGW